MSTRKKPLRSSPSKNRSSAESKRSRTRTKTIAHETSRRRSSSKGTIPLAERIRIYQHEATKPRAATTSRSGYHERVPINERISVIEAKLANKSRPIRSRKSREDNTLRLATPERALELMNRYFNNPNPKSRKKK